MASLEAMGRHAALMQARIQLGRICDAASDTDGARVLVDRIWPRCVRKNRAALTMWRKDMAASAELRKWFCHDHAPFAAFTLRYRIEPEASQEVIGQRDGMIRRGPDTLHYAVNDPVHNHAVVLLAQVNARNATSGSCFDDGGGLRQRAVLRSCESKSGFRLISKEFVEAGLRSIIFIKILVAAAYVISALLVRVTSRAVGVRRVRKRCVSW